jgi:hypothetical protein
MSDKKLLPCPFCGGEAKRAVVFGRNGVECRTCLCMMRGWLDATPEEIAEQWNTREPMERIVERLEESKGTYIDEHGKELYQEDYFIDIDEAIKIVKAGGLND